MWAVAALSLALSLFAVRSMDGFLRPEKGTEVTFRAPAGEVRVPSTLRAAAFLGGLRLPASHLFWIQTLQYYGDYDNARDGYRLFYDYCRLTAELDPHFIKPYELGTAVLAFQVGRPQEAVELLRYGIALNPQVMRLKLLLAAVGYLNADRLDTVVPLLEDLVRSGDAPPMMVNILANTYQKLGRRQDAIRLWRWILAHSQKNEDRDIAARALERLYRAPSANGGKAAS